MDKTTKNSLFCVILVLLGGYVVYEGMNIVDRASKPPFNIKDFSISPGFFPVVLGIALIIFSCVLLIINLKDESSPLRALYTHLQTSSRAMDNALCEPDTLRVIVCVGIMFVYSFFFLGQVPFWIGAFLFLVVLIRFLRASKLWIIALTSGLTVYGIVVLFQDFFSTALP